MKIKLIKEIKHYVGGLSPWAIWPTGAILCKEPNGFINRKIVANCWLTGLREGIDYFKEAKG